MGRLWRTKLPGFAKSPETIGGRTVVEEVGENVEESMPSGRAGAADGFGGVLWGSCS